MLQELGQKLVPKPEERLLAVVNALLQRCYKFPAAPSADVPGILKQELTGVCRACFSDQSNGRGGRLVRASMRDAFVRDLSPEGPKFPATLGEVAERLKAWRNSLQADLEDKMPSTLKLEVRPKGAIIDVSFQLPACRGPLHCICVRRVCTRLHVGSPLPLSSVSSQHKILCNEFFFGFP